MAVSEQAGGDQTKSAEELQKLLNDANSKYENLQTAHDKLKEDLKTLKATSSDAAELQKQIEKHVTDKSKLMREKDELQNSFDGYKKDIQKQAMKQHLTTALEEAGARNASTAMKLIDLEAIKFDDSGNVVQQSVADAVLAIKTSDPVLFKEEGEVDPKSTASGSTTGTSPPTPAVKAAVDRVTKSAYETEMAAAVKSGKQENVEAVAQKYLAKA